MNRFVFYFAILAVLSVSLTSFAKNVKLTWDPNSEITLSGYKIYYGTLSQNYTKSIDIGNSISGTVTNLDPGQAYYFAVTAYDNEGNESLYSKELHYFIPRDGMPWLKLLLSNDSGE